MLDWLIDVLMERFGKKFSLENRQNYLVLGLLGSDVKIYFDNLAPALLKPGLDIPCAFWRAQDEGWTTLLKEILHAPGVKKLPTPLIEKVSDEFYIHYDILGLTYWMLSRQEEVGRIDLDTHDRFPATASHAFKYGYLDRPIVDEWLWILGQVIKKAWPGLKLSNHQFNIKVSHDVDIPSRYAFLSLRGTARAVAADVLKRRNVITALHGLWLRSNSKTHLHSSDPFNVFDWIMETSDHFGIKSAFYFICGRTDTSKDAAYELEHPAIRDLMKRIHLSGHEIGLHPSYGAFRSSDVVISEAARMKRVCAEEGIHQLSWGGRMHFLRWETPTTLYGWEQAGFSYETTLGYADLPGFRCGTCFEYPAFDPVARKPLRLRIRPLIAMECTVIAERYMALGTGSAAASKFLELKNACRAVNGSFTLLWHNSELISPNLRRLYQVVLKE